MEYMSAEKKKKEAFSYHEIKDEPPSKPKPSPSKGTSLKAYRESAKLRSSQDTSIPEDQWETAKNSGLIFPVGPRKQLWDVLIMLLIIFSCADVPYRIGLNAPAEGVMLFFELFVTVSFCIDIYLNFNSAFLDGDRFIIDRKQIAINYISSWFIIDAASSFPLEVMELVAHAFAAPGEKHESSAPTNQVVRVLRLFRLVRLLRLAKLQQYINLVEDRLRVNLQVLNLIKMVLFLVYLMHVLGCGFFYLANNSSEEVTWLKDYDGGSALTAEPTVQYLYSVYWALMTLTTVGYGDIVATNNAERLYVLMTLLIGAIVFGYVLSSVGELISNIDPNASAVDERLKEVKNYMRWHHVPTDLAVRVRKYVDFFFTSHSPLDEDAILATLTPQLRREMQHHLLKKTVGRIPLFDDASADMLLDLHKRLSQQLFDAKENLSNSMSEMGKLTAFGFLCKGVIAAKSRFAFAGANLNEHITCWELREPGSLFGESSLFNDTHELRKAWVTYQGVTRVESLYLEPADLIEVLSEHAPPDVLGDNPDCDDLATQVFSVAITNRVEYLWQMRLFVSFGGRLSEMKAAAARSPLARKRLHTVAAVAIQCVERSRKLQKCLSEASDGKKTLDEILPPLYGIKEAKKKDTAMSLQKVDRGLPLKQSTKDLLAGVTSVAPSATPNADAPSRTSRVMLNRRASNAAMDASVLATGAAQAAIATRKTLNPSMKHMPIPQALPSTGSTYGIPRQMKDVPTPRALPSPRVTTELNARLVALETQGAKSAQQIQQVLTTVERLEQLLQAKTGVQA